MMILRLKEKHFFFLHFMENDYIFTLHFVHKTHGYKTHRRFSEINTLFSEINTLNSSIISP